MTDLILYTTDDGQSHIQLRAKDQAVWLTQREMTQLCAVTRKTAAELITARANPADPHFGLLAWKGDKVRKADIVVAKNYLNEDELDTLNRLTVIFLETALLRASQLARQTAIQTDTHLVIVKDGQLLRLSADELRSRPNRRTPPHHDRHQSKTTGQNALEHLAIGQQYLIGQFAAGSGKKAGGNSQARRRRSRARNPSPVSSSDVGSGTAPIAAAL